MKNFSLLIIALASVISCGKKELNEKATRDFYTNIATGNNLATDDYLSENFSYEDVIFKQVYNGKTDYVKSLAPDPSFKYDCDSLLAIKEISTLNDSMVWVKGEYCGYVYNDRQVDPMRFISILYFDKEGKIHHQEDWKDHSLSGIIEMYQFRNSFIQSE